MQLSQHGWFITENPIEMDDLRVPPPVIPPMARYPRYLRGGGDQAAVEGTGPIGPGEVLRYTEANHLDTSGSILEEWPTQKGGVSKSSIPAGVRVLSWHVCIYIYIYNYNIYIYMYIIYIQL